MSLIRELPVIMDEARERYSDLKSVSRKREIQSIFESKGIRERMGTFVLGDNAEILEDGLRSGIYQGKFDMIYCDPPFFTRGDRGTRIPVKSEAVPEVRAVNLKAYHDRWNSGTGRYLTGLALRLMLMRDALKETGSIFLHLDWHAAHAVKLLMDEIFGEKNFINEIIWTYKSGGAAKRHLARKHDTILFYAKNEQYKFYQRKEKSYNRNLKPYYFKGVSEYEDEVGWYTLVNQKDVWSIDMVGRSSSERLNYATQKPEALIRRMIELVTDEGDLCGDFYCGSGTLASAAEKTGRRFVCVDASPLALINAMKRPLRDGYGFLVQCNKGFGQSCCRASAYQVRDRIILESFSGWQIADIINQKDRSTIARILEEDPFALIDYWCAGITTQDGVFHEVKTVFRDKKGHIEREMQSVQTNCNSIWVTDIFGQTARAFIDGKPYGNTE